jgi:double-stranded uracil-DNA glycosylase
VARVRPEIVAFVGVTAYQRCVREDRTPGAGAKEATIAGARVFVLPNPSGLNASYPGFAAKLVWFRRLAEYAGDAAR